MEINITEFKPMVEGNNLPESLYVFHYSDNSFIALQYVDTIAEMQQREKVYIEALDEIQFSDNVFGLTDNNLYILNVPKFETTLRDLSHFKNVIVVCGQINKPIKDIVLKTAKYVSFPKLEEWQALDYMQRMCTGLTDKQIKWLYDLAKGDIYRITNELKKISIFVPEMQQAVMRQIYEEGGYDDMSVLTPFNFINALLRDDRKMVALALQNIEGIGVEAPGLAIMLYRNMKNITHAVINPRTNPADVGMSDKQFKAIMYSYKHLDPTSIIDSFEFLTSFDYNLKSGNILLNNKRMVDYIVIKLLSYA